MKMIKVMHVITGTGVGGAETMLFKLLSAMDRNRFRNIVYSMIDEGPTAERIRGLGIEVHSLRMKPGRIDLRSVTRLASAIRRWRPDVIQTWMYHADLLGGVVARFLSGVPVVWNVRHSNLHSEGISQLTFRVAKTCAVLSGCVPERIVFCAQSSQLIHQKLGYSASKMLVIPNGFDLDTYRPIPDAELICSQRFGIPLKHRLISSIARYHPQKDHRTFIAAARICISSAPDTLFALCGDGIAGTNQELMNLIRDAALEKHVFLLGRRDPSDIAAIMSRSSLVTSSSSWGEAFPNILGEAMACGTICVATDIGDSAYIIGDTGVIVPSRSPDELAAGWRKVLDADDLSRIALQNAARLRIKTNFSLPAISAQYENLYMNVIGAGAPGGRSQLANQ